MTSVSYGFCCVILKVLSFLCNFICFLNPFCSSEAVLLLKVLLIGVDFKPFDLNFFFGGGGSFDKQ